LLQFNWKFLVPLSLVLILVAALIGKAIPAGTSPIMVAIYHLVTNLVVGFLTLQILRRNARIQRTAQEALLAERRRAAGYEMPAISMPTPTSDAHHHAVEAHAH
jgi:hypothetical protein